jgi:hypothetical protein
MARPPHMVMPHHRIEGRAWRRPMSPQREFLIKFVSATIFETLWPDRMTRDRVRRQSLKGIATTTMIRGLGSYYGAYLRRRREEERSQNSQLRERRRVTGSDKRR